MSARDRYVPAPAFGARIHREGDAWTLVLVRDLRHPPERVWEAITQPEHLRAWAPFDSDTNLGKVGTAQLTTVGAPKPIVAESRVKRAEPHRLLELTWGDQNLRWELEPQGAGTRLTLWHNINRSFIAMGATGWHLCLDVLDRHLAGDPIGRLVGPAALQFGHFQRLHAEYQQELGVQSPKY